MPEFQKLFEPGRIGTIEVKNRIIMPPCGTHYASLDGFVSDRLMTYYDERAKGGAGLIVTECAGCRKRGKPGRILINEDKYIPGMGKLADVIHKGGQEQCANEQPHGQYGRS